MIRAHVIDYHLGFAVADMTETPFRRLEHEIGGLFGRHRYPVREHRPEGYGDTAMSLGTIEADVSKFIADGMDKAADLYNHLKDYAEQKLPEASADLKAVAGNPVVDAVLSAVHLSPSMLTTFADMITKADAEWAAAGVTAAESPLPVATAAEPAAEAAPAS